MIVEVPAVRAPPPMAQADERVGGQPVVFCPKDSCPDRAKGEFADPSLGTDQRLPVV